jgi:hypothetical protein
MMYCYNEKMVDPKRGKRGKNVCFSKILSWQVLGGRGKNVFGVGCGKGS